MASPYSTMVPSYINHDIPDNTNSMASLEVQDILRESQIKECTKTKAGFEITTKTGAVYRLKEKTKSGKKGFLGKIFRKKESKSDINQHDQAPLGIYGVYEHRTETHDVTSDDEEDGNYEICHDLHGKHEANDSKAESSSRPSLRSRIPSTLSEGELHDDSTTTHGIHARSKDNTSRKPSKAAAACYDDVPSQEFEENKDIFAITSPSKTKASTTPPSLLERRKSRSKSAECEVEHRLFENSDEDCMNYSEPYSHMEQKYANIDLPRVLENVDDPTKYLKFVGLPVEENQYQDTIAWKKTERRSQTEQLVYRGDSHEKLIEEQSPKRIVYAKPFKKRQCDQRESNIMSLYGAIASNGVRPDSKAQRVRSGSPGVPPEGSANDAGALSAFLLNNDDAILANEIEKTDTTGQSDTKRHSPSLTSRERKFNKLYTKIKSSEKVPYDDIIVINGHQYGGHEEMLDMVATLESEKTCSSTSNDENPYDFGMHGYG